MNIIINEEQRSKLWSRKIGTGVIFGSQLYGTANSHSDTDILYFYQDFEDVGVPQVNCFQFKKDNIDEIWVGTKQFWHLFNKGDSSIFTEYVLFSSNLLDVLAYCRTYNVIKGLLGLVKRDCKIGIKFKNYRKIKFAIRCLYLAEELLKGEYPSIVEMNKLTKLSSNDDYVNGIMSNYEELRTELNRQYENDELNKYYIPKISNSVHQLLVNSNNLKEWKYDNKN